MSARRRVGKKAEGGAVIRALKPLRGAGWWIPAAAAVILLLVFAVPRLMESLASGGEEPVALFDQYFERPAAEGHLAPTGQGDSLERRWSEAMLAYGNGDCGRFLELSAGLAGQAGFKEGAAAHLYTGACLLGQRQGIEAMAELRQVPAQAIGLYRQAKWYMGLAYLLMQDEESAKEILGEIEGDEANSKQEEAGEILRKL